MFKLILFFGLVSACTCMSMSAKSSKSMTYTGPDGVKKMFFAQKSDLDGSASGYIYHSDGKSPATLVQLGESHYFQPHDFAQLVHHGYEPFLHHAKGFEGGYFGGPHFVAPHFEGHFGAGKIVGGGKGFGGGKFYGGGKGFIGGGGIGGEGGKYIDENGEQYQKEFYQKGGENAGKGFKEFKDFNEEDFKKFAQDQESGYQKEAGGEKKSHFDEGEKFEEGKEEKKGEEGENFKSEKSHKKGHKTTGFHNVYHKDEFKKQHSFYDEADNGGHYDKFGKNFEAQGAAGGGYKKGGHHNSGYQEGEFAKKGDFHKGLSEKAEKGFQGSEGGSSHYGKDEEYGNKGGKLFHKSYGFGGHSEHGY